MTKRFLVSRKRRFAVPSLAAAAGAAALSLPSAASAATVTFENPAPIVIPDPETGPGTPYPSTINVSGFSGPVEDVDASIRSYSHACPADVDILLEGPGGERTLLLSDSGGWCSPEAVNTTISFDDEAATSYPCDATPSGTFKPTNDACSSDSDAFPPPAPPGPYPVALSVFDGTDPNGDWHLYVIDEEFGPGPGSIANGWSVTVTAPVRVDRTLTLDTNKGKVEKGRKVRLTGQIDSPQNQQACEPGQTVDIQRKRKGQPDTAYKTVEQVVTDATGNFSDKERVRKTSIYRAQLAETATCDDGLSNTEKVKVKKPK
jgi:hypothetical protein